MIILDFNQVCLANLMVAIGNHTNVEVELGLLRHMVLNSVRAINSKFRGKYGELIIACDDGRYWRKQLFPYYKAHRKRDRDASELNWSSIFESLNQIRSELRENFSYRVIQVEHAEADDIIATLCLHFGDTGQGEDVLKKHEPILIVSGDKDFQQLHRFWNVDQYDPTKKKFIKCDNPGRFLKEHIIRGDAGDGVPNILSNDDTIISGGRQKRLVTTKVEAWLDLDPKDFCDSTMLRNWYRNEAMIDLTKIPLDIQIRVMSTYEEQGGKDRSKLFNYFVQAGLKNLMQSIQDF